MNEENSLADRIAYSRIIEYFQSGGSGYIVPAGAALERDHDGYPAHPY